MLIFLIYPKYQMNIKIISEKLMNTKRKFYLSLAIVQIFLVIIVFFTVSGFIIAASAQSSTDNYKYYNSTTSIGLALAAALAIGLSAIGSGIAMKNVGTAAISALIERDESFGKVIVIVALCEALAIYGLIVAFLLMFRIPSPP